MEGREGSRGEEGKSKGNLRKYGKAETKGIEGKRHEDGKGRKSRVRKGSKLKETNGKESERKE